MTKEDFKARVSMAYEGREQWETFLNRVWSIHTSELPRWISVADELPKDGEYVATINTVGVKDVRHYSHGKWYSNFGNEYDDITHWMHLPKMPIVSNSVNIGKDLKGGEV